MICIRGIDHIVLRAIDMARMRSFYCEVLGCAVEAEQTALGLIHLRAGDALIDLIDVTGPLGSAGGPPPGREAHNLDHVCLYVEPFDEAALRAHLAHHGVATEAAQARFGARGIGPSLYLHDPEGNTVELKGSAPITPA